MHEIEVSLHVKIGIVEDKKVTVGNIATAIKNIGIEPKIAEQIIQTIDEKKVETLCGSKYQRGNGDNCYQRGGTFDRDPVTAIGGFVAFVSTTLWSFRFNLLVVSKSRDSTSCGMTTSSFFLFRTRTNEGRSSQHQPGQIYDLKIINRDEVAGLIASNVDNNRQVLTICSSLNSWILLNGKVIFRFKVDYRRRFFDNPDNMTRLFVRSASLGIKAVQLIGYQPLVVALMKAEKISGDFFVAVTIPRGDFASNLDLVSMLEPEFISVHAQFCDENDSRLSEWIDMIRDAGAKPAASTHSPGSTIPLLDEMGFEAYLAPVNTVGYGMEPDVESILKALERTKKAVIAIKPLAAGKLSPEKSVFKYIYSYADSIAVGITSEEEMEETYQLLLDADKKNIILVIIPALYDL